MWTILDTNRKKELTCWACLTDLNWPQPSQKGDLLMRNPSGTGLHIPCTTTAILYIPWSTVLCPADRCYSTSKLLLKLLINAVYYTERVKPTCVVTTWCHRTPLCHIWLLNLDVLQGSFRLCNWLSLRRLVSLIDHLPLACLSTFWKWIFKHQLGCRFDTLDSISSFF